MKEYVGAELLTEWQTRLGLHDWTIKLVDNCNPDEMTIQDAVGCADWTESSKVARIEIIDPRYYGNRILPFDYEKTLVHELLHLKTCLVSDMVSDLQTRFTHQLIDDLARAFVDAKRGTDSKSVCGVNNDIRSTDEEHLSDDLCEDEKETETVNGKWRKGIGENGVTTSLFCPNCHYENKHWDNWNFCPHCGENMRAE